MKKTFLLTLSLALFAVAAAKPVTQETAMRVAENFLNQKGVSSAKVSLVDVSSAVGISDIYFFNASDNSCFVLVAADDVAIPILGYSATNGLGNVYSLPENFMGWVRHYSGEIHAAVEAGLTPCSETTNRWQKLINNAPSTKDADLVVGPLIETHWDQSQPYNNLCPYDSSPYGNMRSATGCVATAMAQVMRYWTWPLRGSGNKSYYCSSISPAQTLSVDFGSTVYQWDLMPVEGTLNAKQKKAIATLMYHCGVSVGMSYGWDGSGVSPTNIPTAMKTYFCYTNSLKNNDKSSYTDANWLTMIKAELDARRPIVYGGTAQDGSDGHSFVCDGYASNDYLHFNWGWSGDSDGLYAVNSLTPGTVGIGGGSSYNFSYYQHATTGIRPALETFNTFTLANTTFAMDSQITGTCKIRNYSMGKYCGYLGVGAFNAEGNLVAVMAKTDSIAVNANASYTININYKATWPLYGGSFNARAIASIDGVNWVPIDYGYNSTPIAVPFTTTGVSGIDDIDVSSVIVTSRDRNIVVAGAEGSSLSVIDIMGRVVYNSRSASSDLISLPVPKNGVYMVKVGNAPARKVIVK